MSALKCKSSVTLIIGIITTLLFIPIWYTMLVPSAIVSALEKIDITTSYEGIWEFPSDPILILMKAHVYAEEVKGENIILKFEVNTTSLNATLPELSGNSTYVINKFTRENVISAPEADKPRRGYDYFYPLHLKAGEGIPYAWLDNLNTVATLEFREKIVEEGVTLYKYFAEKIITTAMFVEDIGVRNVTLVATKTILIEPLSGLWAYTEKETLHLRDVDAMMQLLYLEYKSTAEAKAQGLADVKAAYDSVQLLELYVPLILGVIIIVLTIALAYNVRRVKRKKPPEPNLQSPASR